MTRHLAGRFRLGDHVQKVVPLRISEQNLEIAGQPILDSRLGLLCMAFEADGELLNDFCFHASSPSEVYIFIRVLNSASIS